MDRYIAVGGSHLPGGAAAHIIVIVACAAVVALICFVGVRTDRRK